ncbi:MAG: hypothetical protein ACK5LX_04305 [Oscillospiraceae bacterium]
MDMTKAASARAKQVETGTATDSQLEAIGRYTRRAMKREELFLFSVILCDNEVDRDRERFTRESLKKLAGLFVGKTGVFDHSALAENQSARIFEAKVEEDGTENSMGEPYAFLKAWAYMVRCEKNADLILEIDAGIKKEVSVGCAVGKILCSVCGSDVRGAPCAHVKGEEYKGVRCHHLLCEPSDAYEWSFVAVPAQPRAGVTKRLGGKQAVEEAGGSALEKLEKAAGRTGLSLSKGEAAALQKQMERLSGLAEAGDAYLEELRGDIIRCGALSRPELDAGVLEEVVGGMDLVQLKAFHKSFAAEAKGLLPCPQLGGPAEAAVPGEDGQYKI